MPPVDVRFKVVPAQTGPSLPAVGVGNALTVALVVAVEVQPEAFVTVTVYTPDMAVVAFALLGFCTAELNPAGPDQL